MYEDESRRPQGRVVKYRFEQERVAVAEVEEMTAAAARVNNL